LASGTYSDLTGLDAAEIARLVRAREVSPVEVVRVHLERCSDDPCNAIVAVLHDRALAEARRAEHEEAIGPLHGVPFTVKDAIATDGIRTTSGSLFLKDNVPAEDAPAIARLREAGGILIAKTNCPEFAFGPRTENAVFGRTVNPHDARLAPGGSSGGCAAAVATGCTPFSLGTDFGGSLRWPPHCCGVIGMRPSPETVPAEGQVPPAAPGPRGELSLIGPTARTARDIRLVLEVLNGPLDDSLPSRCLWARDEGTLPVRADVAAGVERAANALAGAGLDVEEGRPDGLDEAEPLYSRWRETDDLADLRELGEGHEELFSPYIQWLFARVGEARPDPHIADRAAELTRRVSDALGDAILLLPVALTPALPHEAIEVVVNGRRIDVNGMKVLGPCRAISVLGFPAVAVPAGTSADGLPIGVQVVGRRGTDGKVLAVAELIERELGEARVTPRAG
jgi:Asp-tRNA(Asn)/Glu-tRNA(Gln) amidotransferase A subunit family amidase